MADFYTDHNVAIEVAPALGALGHTVRTAQGLGLERAEDDEHLLVAAQQNWVLITHNRKDFILLHRAWQRWSRAWRVSQWHAGILIVPQEWLPRQIAQEVDSFIQTHTLLSNQLYVWRPSSGWANR